MAVRKNRICQIIDCGSKHYCKGFCRFHYDKNRRRGNPFLSGRLRKDPKRTPILLGDLAYIPLSDSENPEYAVIDREDLKIVGKYTWCKHQAGYAQGSLDGKRPLMHQLIMGYKGIDHLNGDGLDNRKINLRYGPQYLNVANIGLSRHNTSGYKGVSWDKKKGKWAANIHLGNKKYFLGFFETKEDAAIAYNKRAFEQWGSYARLNDIEKGGVVNA
jgi:hypothetical protein